MAATPRPKAGTGKPEVERFITDERMLLVRDYCVKQKISGISSTAEWLKAIGINPSNQTLYTTGRGSFTKQHHYAVGKMFGISMEFLYGFSDAMFRTTEDAYTSTEIFDHMRASLALLETQLRIYKELADNSPQNAAVEEGSDAVTKTAKTSRKSPTKTA